MYKDALDTLERKFGHTQAVASAHLDKLNHFPTPKMPNSENIINYSAAMSSLVGFFTSLSYDADLKSASLLNQPVQKSPPNMNESWSLYTVEKHWVKPTLLEFNEAHNRMKQSATKARPEKNSTSVTKTKSASKVFASNSQQGETKKQMPSSSTNTHSRCIICKCNHRLGECRVLKEKPPTQRTKWVADNKLCFSCLRDRAHSASVLNQESAEQRGAIVRITYYCMGQIGFSQQNSQQIPTLTSPLATQVTVKSTAV